MVNRILFMTGLLLCFAASASAAEEQAPALEREPRRLFSLSYGTFLPGSDMRPHDFQAGTDVTVGVTRFWVNPSVSRSSSAASRRTSSAHGTQEA
jgi:hypothetical protein